MKKALLFPLILALAACTAKSGGSGSASSTTVTAAAPSASQVSVQLAWAASAGSPSGYYVEESPDGTNYSLVQTVTTTGALVGSLSIGHTYYFRVRAYNAGGSSAYSNIFSVTP